MTSPSRRKRRTIVRSTPTATRSSTPPRFGDVIHVDSPTFLRGLALFIATLLCAIAIEAQSAPIAGEKNTVSDRSVEQASYSTGSSGNRLKWLVHQPDAATDNSAVRPTQYTTPSSTSRHARLAQNQRPSTGGLDSLNDRKRTPSPAPAVPLSDDLLPAEPKTDAAPPAMTPTPPTGSRNGVQRPRAAAPDQGVTPRGNAATESMLEQYYSKRGHAMEEVCPSPKDLKHIADLSTNINPSDGELPRECPLSGDVFQYRSFSPITYSWTASGLCHKPLYFEDVQLERYGHMAGPWVQPFASAAHFFLTVPILPYKMGLETPNECMYTLGYYRPGNCAPYLFDPIPLSARGALFEAGAWVGGVFLFP